MYGLKFAGTQLLMGVNTIITAAKAYTARNQVDQGYMYCPCRDRKNLRQLKDYTIWSKHAEVGENVSQKPFDDAIMPE
jgi:hypothetical protein